MKHSPEMMRDVDYDDDENLFPCHEDEDDDAADDDDDDSPVYLHSGRFKIPSREQLAARIAHARHIILERNSDSIRGNSNVMTESIGDVCFKVHKKNKLK